MQNSSRFSTILTFASLLLLSGCGEGWEVVRYTGNPYGERTAGTGIQYVRAVMNREKGPKLETQLEESAPKPVKEGHLEPKGAKVDFIPPEAVDKAEDSKKSEICTKHKKGHDNKALKVKDALPFFKKQQRK